MKTRKRLAEKSLLTLGLSYIDLYLIHWPANEKQFGERAEEINAETWRAFEELYSEGKIRAAGVSNFLPHHLETLKKTAKFMPVVDQIEARPGFWQEETLDYCRAHSILVEAWSPLGRGASLALPGDRNARREVRQKSRADHSAPYVAKGHPSPPPNR